MRIPEYWLGTLETETLQKMLVTAETSYAEGKDVISFSDVGGSVNFSRQYNTSEMLDSIAKHLVKRGVLTLYTTPVVGLTILN